MSANTKPDLLNGPVLETIKQMTVPMTYGMVLLMTFNLVDTFFVGLLGTQPLAAISFTFPVTFTIISFTIGLGIGTSAVIAKSLGEDDTKKARYQGTIALYLTAILVGVLAVLSYFFTDQIFSLLGANESTLPLIHQYMDIWLLGCIGLIGPMVGNAILRANGDTKTPSMIMGFAGLINAVLDPILIFGWGPVPAMGVQGAALATLVSWILGLILIIYILAIKRKLIFVCLPGISVFKEYSRPILAIGLPAAGANMLTPFAAAIMTAIVASYGDAAVAAFGVGSRLESIACLVILALSMTLPPFISQNFGAGNMDRVKESYKGSVRFVIKWQVLVYLVMLLASPLIARIFTNEEEVAHIIKLFLLILPLGYGLQGIIILTNSSFNALHKPMAALVLSFIRFFIFYVPLSFIGSYYFGLVGFFAGALVGVIFMACLSYYLFIRQFRGCSLQAVS